LQRGFAPDRVTVVRPGIPYLAAETRHKATEAERQAARAQWGITAEAFVISAVGRLSTEKRFDLYLETCAALAPRLPNAMFLLVGGGQQGGKLPAPARTPGP